jgi:predicted RNase H-like HicB family nuclease
MKTRGFARIPLLKNCMLQGDGQEEVLPMLDEAKELSLETTLEEGVPIPKPTGVTPL